MGSPRILLTVVPIRKNLIYTSVKNVVRNNKELFNCSQQALEGLIPTAVG